MDTKTLSDNFRGVLVGWLHKEVKVMTKRTEMVDNRLQGEFFFGTLTDVGADYIRLESEDEEDESSLIWLFPFEGLIGVELFVHGKNCEHHEEGK